MAATVVFNATNISLVNDATGFTVLKRSAGGATPTATTETDVYLQGTGACSVQVSNQDIVLWYTSASTDLSASGPNAGCHVFIWANMLAAGLMDYRVNGGLAVVLGNDTTHYGMVR